MRDPARLSKLLALLTIAFGWCYRVGEWRNEQKPVRRLKHGRPAHSLFRYGLDYLNRILLTSMSNAVDKLEQVLGLLFRKHPLEKLMVT